MSDRSEFEGWASQEWPKVHLDTKGDTGDYLYKTAEFAWQAWQAARAQSGQGAEPVAEFWKSHHYASQNHISWLVDIDDLPDDSLLYTQPQPAQQESVPEGWKLVPVEPTGDMEEAGCQGYMEADGNWVMHRSSMGHAYRAMLSAAPQPPKESE